MNFSSALILKAHPELTVMAFLRGERVNERTLARTMIFARIRLLYKGRQGSLSDPESALQKEIS